MSEITPQNPQENSDATSVRIRDLRDQIASAARQGARKRRLYQRLGIGLIAFCAVYMTFVTNRAFQLDAHALAEFGRVEVERQLPGGVRSLADYLKSQAPSVVSKLLRSIVDKLPELREKLVVEVTERNAVLVRELEEQLSLLSNEVVKAGRLNVDALEGDYTDVEKIEILMTGITDQVRSEVTAALDALHPRYASELSRIRSFLVNLQEKGEDELTEREKAQKELIQTTLQLMLQENSARKTADRKN